MLSTLSVEEDLKKKTARRLWNRVFNAAVDSIVKPYIYRWMTRYTSKIDNVISYER